MTQDPHHHHGVHGADHSSDGANASDVVAMSEQHAFVSGAIVGARRVLEVGAGRGHLARRLGADGFEVTALDLALPMQDSSGVRWVEQDFLAFEDEPFDAVVFTASLHHVCPLAAALDRATQILVPGGVLVVDDFDLEAPDEETLRWYYEVQELLAVAGAYDAGHIDAAYDGTAVERWRAAHEHHGAALHTGGAMLSAIAERFGPPSVTREPYQYRYISRGASSPDVARHVLAVETRRIAEGSLRAVGLRIVARRA
jgi:SAM-dependent methyltransferase